MSAVLNRKKTNKQTKQIKHLRPNDWMLSTSAGILTQMQLNLHFKVVRREFYSAASRNLAKTGQRIAAHVSNRSRKEEIACSRQSAS